MRCDNDEITPSMCGMACSLIDMNITSIAWCIVEDYTANKVCVVGAKYIGGPTVSKQIDFNRILAVSDLQIFRGHWGSASIYLFL